MGESVDRQEMETGHTQRQKLDWDGYLLELS